MSIYSKIILYSTLFGSVYIFSTSIKLLNDMYLIKSNSPIYLKLINYSTLMFSCGIYFYFSYKSIKYLE